MSCVTIEPATTENDGRHAFDFLFGRWRVENRKLQNPLDPSSTEWMQFRASVETKPVLGGLGNVDLYSAPAFPQRPGFEALALRLFDPGPRVWRIWWASTAGAGQLDAPVLGRFADGTGVFECDDVLDGRVTKVRYEWLDIHTGSPRWQQSFSFDAGSTWRPNWIMVWRREPL
jgi:hypothetical protein